MLTSGLTVHVLKCIVRGHVCCPVIHDSSFHSSFHFKSPQRLNEKKKQKKKQCIANTIKNTIEVPLHLTERAPSSNKEGGTYSRAGPLSVQCSRRLLIFDFKVRRSFEGGALSIEGNRMLCFSKERLFISHFK